MSEKQTIKSARSLEDERNRSVVQALLALKDQTLMSVLRTLPGDFPEKMDYPNTAAWLRGIPGRFGIRKQRALLGLLGYVDGHLDTSKNHQWLPVLESRFDPDKYESIDLMVKTLLKELVNGTPYHKAYLKTPDGLPLGMAVDFAGATVIFPITNDISLSEINNWLSTIERWHQVKTSDIEITRKELEDYLAGNAFLDFKTSHKISPLPDDWAELVARLTDLGITPSQVWKWTQANLNNEDY